MAYFVLAGIQDCKNYIHALYVCNYLEKQLPDFKLFTIERTKDEWGAFLNATNKKYGWHHRTSPLIWKELCYRGGTAYLIGGLSEFWEYCYDYYGLSSNIPFKDLLKLVEEHLKQVEKLDEKGDKSDPGTNTLNIFISGASNPMLRLLLCELVCGVDYSPKPLEIKIKLFDHYAETKENAPFIKTIMEEFLVLEASVKKSIELVYILADGLRDCDLFIIADWFKIGTTTDLNDKIIKKISTILLYADVINAFGKRGLKVIVAGDGPVCLNATVLVETCTRIRITNIVAVTSDVGLPYLTEVSKQTGIPVEHLGAPPVWGFIGINQYIDLDSTIHYSDVFIPFTRALRDLKNSTLPMGTTKPELRFTAYLLEDNEEKLKTVKKRQKAILKKLGRPPGFAKVRAVISLLKMWYSKEPRDDIISLGIFSNGAFGLPNGVVFSQPAMLNKHKTWLPFKQFPVTNKTKAEVEKLIAPTVELLDDYGVSGRGFKSSNKYV